MAAVAAAEAAAVEGGRLLLLLLLVMMPLLFVLRGVRWGKAQYGDETEKKKKKRRRKKGLVLLGAASVFTAPPEAVLKLRHLDTVAMFIMSQVGLRVGRHLSASPELRRELQTLEEARKGNSFALFTHMDAHTHTHAHTSLHQTAPQRNQTGWKHAASIKTYQKIK